MTSMRNALLALSLCLAPALLAQTADLRIVSMLPSGEPAMTGERFAVTVRWRNEGPDPASFIHVLVTGTPKPHYVLSVATSGWPCYPDAEGATFLCQHATLGAGAEADLVLQLITPPAPGTFTIATQISAVEADPNPANNSVTLTYPLQAAPAADLAVSPTSQLYRTEPGTPVTFPIHVRNAGPNAIANLFAVITVPVTTDLPSYTASGSGWSCAHPPYGAHALVCTRTGLEAGQDVPIDVRTSAPAAGSKTYSIRVRGEGYSDPVIGNDVASVTITTEDETQPMSEWARVLVPLTGGEVPGANNARWRTETTALIASDTPIEIHPGKCEVEPPVGCAGVVPPLNRPFDPLGTLVGFGGTPNGQFLYVPGGDAAKLRLNSRVYDASRTEQTAGAEIPIVPERAFTSATVSLVGIPVAPHYRHTLRVYSLDGSPAQVAIRVYANDEITPRIGVVRTLTAPPGNVRTTPQLLPAYPGYLQLELGQLLNLAGIDTVRVDVEPVEAGVRLWSFVSVTNNETHHVTTFSQH